MLAHRLRKESRRYARHGSRFRGVMNGAPPRETDTAEVGATISSHPIALTVPETSHHSNPRLAVLWASALLVSSAFACGGASDYPPGTAGKGDGGGASSGGPNGSSGAGTGSSSGALPPGCSSTPIGGGTPCTGTTSCQYGSDPNIACDTLSICTEGVWESAIPVPGFSCPTGVPGEGGCPKTYPGNGTGPACSPQALGCAYPEGLCICGPPGSGDPLPPNDAGVFWACDNPGPNCPEPRPAAGSLCNGDGLTCSYDVQNLELQCTNGRWAGFPEESQ